MSRELARKVIAEAFGTGLLVAAVIGSGIAAQRLSPSNTGLQLLENSTATAGALVALILAFGSVSGAHLNPVVSLADRYFGGLTNRETASYIEVIATLGLLLVIFGVVRSGRAALAPFAVASYIAAAYWFTSSTSFANPAVTIARTLSNTFAGIKPSAVPPFVIAQLLGGALAIAVAWYLYPDMPADAVVVPHDGTETT